MDQLPRDIQREIEGFGMFAPNLPTSAATVMREHIKAMTKEDGVGDGDPETTGLTVRFEKCGINFKYLYDDDDDDERTAIYYVVISPVHPKMGALDHPGCFYSCDEYTDEGLVLLIHKTKLILKDIEERGFCPCVETHGGSSVKKTKLAGIGMCATCAFKAELGFTQGGTRVFTFRVER
jgi:hypothetical protein